MHEISGLQRMSNEWEREMQMKEFIAGVLLGVILMSCFAVGRDDKK